jgi:hypothetical protein
VLEGHFASVPAADGSTIEVPPPLPTYQVFLGDKFKLVTEPDFVTQSLHKVGVLSLDFSLSGIHYHTDTSSDAQLQILPGGVGGQLLAKNLSGSNRTRQNFWIAWRCPTSNQAASGLPRFHLVARKTSCHGAICPSGFMISPKIEELDAGARYQLLRPYLISPNDRDAADFAEGKIAYFVEAFVDDVPHDLMDSKKGIGNAASQKSDPVVIPFRIVQTESRIGMPEPAP